MLEAIVLAGGFGTRLAHVLPEVCKPMAPIAGQPFLRIILNQLADAQFDKVIIADGYLREQIENYFGSFYRGMEILYSSEDTPLFTGGAAKKALELCTSEYVFILNGDTYSDIEFESMMCQAFENDERPDAIVAVQEVPDCSRYGSIRIDGDFTIMEFMEKQPLKQGLINIGTYLLRSDALKFMPDAFSLETDFFEAKVNEKNFKAYVSAGNFIDIGVPEDYYRAQKELKPLIQEWKIAFFDRDGTLNIDTGHLFEPEKLVLIEDMIPVLRQYVERPDYKVVVVTNQAGVAKGLYSVGQMRYLHKMLNRMLMKKGCRIDAFYYCPHHPDFTGECDCRKPKPGMLLKALQDYDSDPTQCIMYGDKQSDKEAAAAAGIRCVLTEELFQ